jgi:hypothetical protein
MRKHVTRHIKGNIWYWAGGFAVARAAFLALGWSTPAAFGSMINGILVIFADAHVDPVALITEDALHPEGTEIEQPPGTGTGSPVT